MKHLIKSNNMEELAQLHPCAQVAVVICVCVAVCVFFWQVFKTLREF